MSNEAFVAGLQTGIVSAEAFLAFSRACIACTCEEDFCDVVRNHVRPMLPHGVLAAVVGRIDINRLHMLRFVGVDYPAWAIALVPPVLDLRERPVVQTWLYTREPMVLELPRDAARMSERERGEIESFALGRLAIHGLIDLASRTGAYLSFAQVPEHLDEGGVKDLLRLLAPPLGQALIQLHAAGERGGASAQHARLTTIELELLRWIAAGRTNAQIAQLRGRSVATIRNQVHGLFAKLGAGCRAEAVRMATSISCSNREEQ